MSLTDQELLDLLHDLESDRVERKASLADGQRIRRTICAFANDLPRHNQPGVLYVGVDDAGSPLKVQINDDMLRTLANWCSDGSILPKPDCFVQVREVEGVKVIVAEILPSSSPPVRMSGRTWVRIGPTLAVATPEQELRLTEWRQSKDVPADMKLLPPTALLEHLDLDFFRRKYLRAAVATEVLEENRRSETEQLASLKMINNPQECYITLVGMLVLGTRVTDFVPGGYIQFVRFDGTELTDPIIDQKAATGNIIEQIRFMEEVFAAHIMIETDLSGSVEVRHPDYPLDALREILRNAVLHRSYNGGNAPVLVYWLSDRVEIISPGGLYGNVNAGNFGQPGVMAYRNPNLAEAMKYLGLIQKFGWGLQKARTELEKNGNPPFEVQGDGIVRVTIRRRMEN